MGALNCHQARQKPGLLPRSQPRRRRGASSIQTRLLQLAPNILSDVLWALSGCAGESRVFKAISALRSTSRGLRETLDQSQFWQRKVNFILTAYSPLTLQSDTRSLLEPVGPQLCIRLLCCAWLLQSALSCDWMALHDLHLLLCSLGLPCEWSMVLLIRQLVSFSIHVFPPPSVHWLRDLLDGVVKPWEQPSRPPRANDLEGLREWLQRNLSEEVWPWKQLAGTTPFYDDTLSKKHQMKYAGKTVKVATWVLLTRELSAEKVLEALPPVPRAEAFSVRGKAKLRGDRLNQVWMLPLLLAEPLRRQKPEITTGCWSGLALTEVHMQDPRNSNNTSGFVAALRFPELSLDRWWIHSQRGLSSSMGGSKWVQLDARLDATSGVYSGQWVEEGLFRPLDCTAFTLADSRTSFISMISEEAPSKGLIELFGLATTRHEDNTVLRCFYLARCLTDIRSHPEPTAASPLDVFSRGRLSVAQ
ncbi:unnamed protein product [Symbiodinium sp. CCMP2592]|nr:unnamed protein product [Symbiodinium sp. CCMP2592]